MSIAARSSSLLDLIIATTQFLLVANTVEYRYRLSQINHAELLMVNNLIQSLQQHVSYLNAEWVIDGHRQNTLHRNAKTMTCMNPLHRSSRNILIERVIAYRSIVKDLRGTLKNLDNGEHSQPYVSFSAVPAGALRPRLSRPLLPAAHAHNRYKPSGTMSIDSRCRFAKAMSRREEDDSVRFSRELLLLVF
ncbi:hypothetical protein D9613_003562 [Agrocybe pediades]|uniref:Uncharacterized protein n=1 Tax=Agrocybe pediades TaxID=84607 RepID=A0A8H4VLM5_9AGAR|nr:hypothetical protein D9613_003562 [Agrocybe pediades]